jgi:putative phosphoesterase
MTSSPFPQLKDEAMYRDKQFACLVRHIVLDPVSHYLQLKRNSHYSNAAAIIFGHTHVPWQKRIGPYLYVNPGSPHRPREGHNPSVAILEYDGDGYCHAHHHYVSR